MKRWERYGLMMPYLYNRWGIETVFNPTDHEPETVVGNGWDGVVEHAVHELAHAFDLDITVCPGFSQRISQKLSSSRFFKEPINREAAEARALVIEWYALQQIRMTHIDESDLEAVAEIQECLTLFLDFMEKPRDHIHKLFKAKAAQIARCLESEYQIWIKAGRPNIMPKERRVC